MTGEISYNGHMLDEFVPQKTSSYISQYDLHVPEMTVRETIDFSAQCQGVGDRVGKFSNLLIYKPILHICQIIKYQLALTYIICHIDILAEVTTKEKDAGIIPDPDIDAYMKVLLIRLTNML